MFGFSLSYLKLPKRHVDFRWWPTLENPWASESVVTKPNNVEEKIDYEVSADDFVWVEKLIKRNQIPLPSKSMQFPTPSGWVPPNPELSKNVPYSVRRSKNHMLPVYYDERKRKLAEQSHGVRQLTVIKNVDGDMWALAKDLRKILQQKCENHMLLCQVDEVTRSIKIEGIFLEEVSNFLLSKGF